MRGDVPSVDDGAKGVARPLPRARGCPPVCRSSRHLRRASSPCAGMSRSTAPLAAMCAAPVPVRGDVPHWWESEGGSPRPRGCPATHTPMRRRSMCQSLFAGVVPTATADRHGREVESPSGDGPVCDPACVAIPRPRGCSADQGRRRPAGAWSPFAGVGRCPRRFPNRGSARCPRPRGCPVCSRHQRVGEPRVPARGDVPKDYDDVFAMLDACPRARGCSGEDPRGVDDGLHACPRARGCSANREMAPMFPVRGDDPNPTTGGCPVPVGGGVPRNGG